MAPGLQSAGIVVVMHGLSRSMACGIFPDQGLNPCLLHWEADSSPLSHQGSPNPVYLEVCCLTHPCTSKENVLKCRFQDHPHPVNQNLTNICILNILHGFYTSQSLKTLMYTTFSHSNWYQMMCFFVASTG